MENRNCIIIHGCPADKEKAMDAETRTYDKHWLPWTKIELEKSGIPTDIPLMPTPWYPDYDNFKKKFEKYTVNENTIIIATSCGCAFIVRWLGETKKAIKKLIMVAPWKIYSGNNKSLEPFYTQPIDPTITARIKEIVMFTADNEHDIGKKSLKMFHEVLGGEIIELKGHGHYVMKHMGTEEFPELIAVVLR